MWLYLAYVITGLLVFYNTSDLGVSVLSMILMAIARQLYEIKMILANIL